MAFGYDQKKIINRAVQTNVIDPLKAVQQQAAQRPAPIQTEQAAQRPAPIQTEQAENPLMASYVQRNVQAGTQGSTLQDPGQITSVGQEYAKRVAQNLSGNNPLVQNAQNIQDRDSARRNYLAQKQTSENLAQTPFAVGSAQYQRANEQSRAGVEQANLAGQAGVNAYTRQTTADSMDAANRLEDQQYGRAIGERTNIQQSQRELAQSIEDPKARYAFNRAIQNGVPPQEAYRTIVDATGTINKDYRGQTPVGSIKADAEEWITETNPSLVYGSPEYKAAVTERMNAIDKAKNKPLEESGKATEISGVRDKIALGEPLTDDEVKTAITSGVAIKTEAAKAFGESEVGDTISINGEIYKVQEKNQPRTSYAGRNILTGKRIKPRHTDEIKATTQDGTVVYITKNGISPTPVKRV